MLNEILQVQPNDTFARYGLALALAQAGRTDEALGEFERLEAGSPDYVPGYQMAGQLLVKLGRTEEAKEALIRGVAAAERTGNHHAQREMQALLDDLAIG